jgi:hypothetical protein
MKPTATRRAFLGAAVGAALALPGVPDLGAEGKKRPKVAATRLRGQRHEVPLYRVESADGCVRLARTREQVWRRWQGD